MQRNFLLFFCLLSQLGLFAQSNTVGVIEANVGMAPGYSLLAPNATLETYLIDNCGQVINTWSNSQSYTGSSVYLLEDGSLLRTGRVNNANFVMGGLGGRIERFSWDDNLLWSWEYSSNVHTLHHDIAPMPNGNLLVLGVETKSAIAMSLAGRNPALMSDNIMWSEFIYEIQPIGIDSAAIVWQWHAWDHLVQAFDSSKANFGVVAAHPELVDVNYFALPATKDWLHANGLAYDVQRDQIMLTLAHMDEFWILDHGTTTAEAASHVGGTRGKGGDILYRWGNPRSYGRGDSTDQKLFFMHNAHWIPLGMPDSGKVLLFNNGQGRRYSSVEIVALPETSLGEYALNAGQAYGPVASEWIYTSDTLYDFFSKIMSGAQQQANGNILMCNGGYGYALEVDKAFQTQWHYNNPMSQAGAANQGNAPPLGANSLFRLERYAPDFPGFVGKDMTPGLPLEGNPNIQACLSVLTAATNEVQPRDLLVYPNPANTYLIVESPATFKESIILWNSIGQKVFGGEFSQKLKLDIGHLPNGIYILQIGKETRKLVYVIGQ